MEKEIAYITLDRFKSLKNEVHILKTQERKTIADRLSQYRDSVDLLEDISYNDVLQQQADLEEKIEELEDLLENANIIKKSKSGKIHVGSTVDLKRVGDRKVISLTIEGSIDANPLLKVISNESPLGSALLGKKKDEVVTITAQNGDVITYKIIDVK